MKKIVQITTLCFFLFLASLINTTQNNLIIPKPINENNQIPTTSLFNPLQNLIKNKTITQTKQENIFNFKKTSENKNNQIKNLSNNQENIDNDNDLVEFNQITNFLQTKISVKQSYDLYKLRIIKLRKKKEIIVKKIFEIMPLLGEILALADVEKINLIINRFFIIRETELLAKFITMWDTNVNFTNHSAKVLLNLLLCNNRFNKLRCILNLLMEGLCKGDPRSMRIFKEIILTVIIDTIMKTNFRQFNDMQAKFNLIRVFNVGFLFSPIIKIQFLEKMLISEKLKELITFMILKLKSKEEIEILMDLNLHQPLPPMTNYNETKQDIIKPRFMDVGQKNKINKHNFDEFNLENLLDDENKNKNLPNEDIEEFISINSDADPDYENEITLNETKNVNSLNLQNQKKKTSNFSVINNNFILLNKNFSNKKTSSSKEVVEILKNLKLETEVKENESIFYKFKETKTNSKLNTLSYKYLSDNSLILYSEPKLIDSQQLPYSDKQKIKLSDIKEQIKNEYNQMLYKMSYQPMPELDEYIPHYQVGINKRTIYPKYKMHLENLIKLNELLDELPITLPMGSIDVSSPKIKQSIEMPKPIVITKNVNGVNISMQFKEKDNQKLNNSEENKNMNNINSDYRFKSLMKAKISALASTNICLQITKGRDFANKSFEQLTNYKYDPNHKINKFNINYRVKDNYNSDANNRDTNFNKDSNYNRDTNYNKETNYNKDTNIAEITDNASFNIPEIKNIVNNPNKDIKVLFPKEIHTKYQIKKQGTKTIEINQNNPTKKMILDRLLPQEAFNDFINQQEKPSKDEDPSGLFNVLKNIQNRKCSTGYLCIEIGTIYGDFSQLMPQNITIPYDYNKNFHMVIKPILIVNGTVAPNVPVIPVNPINPGNGNMTNLFFQDDDCDDLSILGVKTQETSKNIDFPRFKSGESSVMAEKQNKMINVNFNKIQRKFYRKVAISEEVYSQDTFKQGLNLIIIQRDKKYTKLYEKTFDTNNNRNESEEMADIIKDTPCSKIIVITGIGKWMGAMTPSLMKEIKQIGGPDLNALYSPDEDDNSMADHAFILIGRRGLCRYNGIFRVKNFDLSRTMSKLFPDSSSDPNDCFFDDITLENQKNKNSEKQFFHLIDLRLTLNINNDNRFAWDAPTISTTSPFQGSIHGGQEIKIGGFNLGTHTTDLKEILIGGVICGDYINLSSNLISCVTRASTILGPGAKNIIVKLRNGYVSPARTCNVFEYVGDQGEALSDLKQTIKTVDKMRDLPIYMNSNYHDQDISLFDHMKFNNRFYKQKLKPDHSNHVSIKLDNMVKANYNELIDIVGNDSGLKPIMGGLRKRRFVALMGNIENCDKK